MLPEEKTEVEVVSSSNADIKRAVFKAILMVAIPVIKAVIKKVQDNGDPSLKAKIDEIFDLVSECWERC